jgi:hypothetical protein
MARSKVFVDRVRATLVASHTGIDAAGDGWFTEKNQKP